MKNKHEFNIEEGRECLCDISECVSSSNTYEVNKNLDKLDIIFGDIEEDLEKVLKLIYELYDDNSKEVPVWVDVIKNKYFKLGL